MWHRLTISLLVLVPCLVDAARAQRGGQSEFIRERSGTWVIDAKAPAATPDAKTGEDGKIDLAKASLVTEAAAKGHLSFLFVFDSTQDPVKQKSFEQIIFGHAGISVHLRPFVVGRIDINGNAAATAQFGRQTPLFAAFTDSGKPAGQVSMKGYRASATPIIKLVERAAAKHAKLPLTQFARQYSRFLTDYKVYEGRKRTLDQKRKRLQESGKLSGDKAKAVDKDEAELAADRERLLATEKDLLEKAKVPPRDSRAVQRGVRVRGRR